MRIILTIYIAVMLGGCSRAERPEGRLLGTMSIYSTNKGFVVTSDQTGERMMVNFHVHQIYTEPTIGKE